MSELENKQFEIVEAMAMRADDPSLLADECRWLNPDDLMDSPLRVRRSPGSEEDFLKLVRSIEAFGSNVSPILVRPAGGGKFEIVFGHRRAAACRQLGCQVRAVVFNVGEEELPSWIESENQARLDPCPYDRGRFYEGLLGERRYASAAEMSRALNVTPFDISTTRMLAALDRRVIGAFKSPAELQTAYAKKLTDTWAARQAEMLSRVKHIRGLRQTTPDLKASQVYALLVESPESKQPKRSRSAEAAEPVELIAEIADSVSSSRAC